MACGRGPTTDISPRSTFRNCGSSSRLVRRRKAPTRVTRGSPGAAWVTPASVCATIDRNLKTWNGWPSMPSRACRNRTGPGEDSRTARAMASSSGDNPSSTASANTRSKLAADQAGHARVGRAVEVDHGQAHEFGEAMAEQLDGHDVRHPADIRQGRCGSGRLRRRGRGRPPSAASARSRARGGRVRRCRPGRASAAGPRLRGGRRCRLRRRCPPPRSRRPESAPRGGTCRARAGP